MSISAWQRRLNYVYLIFFIIHIPVMLLVDLGELYPASLRPAITLTIKDYYVSAYRDRFFIEPPLWFKGFVILELVYHLPLSVWAIRALSQDHPMVPLHLLIFAVEMAVTTLACTLEMLSWTGYTQEEQIRLGALYVPYLGFAVLMGTDMFRRLRDSILTKQKAM